MFAVSVDFVVKPEAVESFREHMIAQAENSLDLEPGCRQFDVWSDPSEPTRVFLYELYDDAAAFDAHLASAHFKSFSEAVAPLIQSKEIRRHGLALYISSEQQA